MANTRIPLREELKKKHEKWVRIKALLEQDEQAFKAKPFFRALPNESASAQETRKEYFVSGFINPSQDLVSSSSNAIMKNGFNLEFKSKTSMLATFADNVTLGGDPIKYEEWLKDFVLNPLRANGTVFTVIDKPRVMPKSQAEERIKGMPFLSNIHPLDVLNYQIVDGELMWFAYKRKIKPAWENPLGDRPDEIDAETIITKSQFITRNRDNGEILSEYSSDHNFGTVPVIHQASFITNSRDILGVAAFEQTSNMLISFNYHLGVASWEILKHGGSLLLMPEEAITPQNSTTDREGNQENKHTNQGGQLIYGGQTPPSYLVKELAVKEAMDMANFYIQNAIENERDLKSVSKSSSEGKLDTRSGFSKALDREPLENNLCSLAEDGESYTIKLFEKVARILRKPNDATAQFQKKFDMRTAGQAFKDIQDAQKAKLDKISPTYMKEIIKGPVASMVSDSDTQEKIYREIDSAELYTPEDELIDGILKEDNPMQKVDDVVPNGGRDDDE